MNVGFTFFRKISWLGAIGALLVILGLATAAVIRAHPANASTINRQCDWVTSTLMEDRMPLDIGQEWHLICKDKGARVINPNNDTSYIAFQVYVPLNHGWSLYDLKYVKSEPYDNGDFSFGFYTECNPTQPKGTKWDWQAYSHLIVDYSDGKWAQFVHTTNAREEPCDPGSPGGS